MKRSRQFTVMIYESVYFFIKGEIPVHFEIRSRV